VWHRFALRGRQVKYDGSSPFRPAGLVEHSDALIGIRPEHIVIDDASPVRAIPLSSSRSSYSYFVTQRS
jgi:hypothetical protein